MTGGRGKGPFEVEVDNRYPARHVVVDIEKKKLIIDGVDFPWFFGNDWTVTTNGVNLTIFADVVEVRRQ